MMDEVLFVTPARQLLAGGGAWTPDMSLLSIVSLVPGCVSNVSDNSAVMSGDVDPGIQLIPRYYTGTEQFLSFQ